MSKLFLPVTIASFVGLLNLTAAFADTKAASDKSQSHCPKLGYSCCDTSKKHACKGNNKREHLAASCCKTPCCEVGDNCCS